MRACRSPSASASAFLRPVRHVTPHAMRAAPRLRLRLRLRLRSCALHVTSRRAMRPARHVTPCHAMPRHAVLGAGRRNAGEGRNAAGAGVLRAPGGRRHGRVASTVVDGR